MADTDAIENGVGEEDYEALRVSGTRSSASGRTGSVWVLAICDDV